MNEKAGRDYIEIDRAVASVADDGTVRLSTTGETLNINKKDWDALVAFVSKKTLHKQQMTSNYSAAGVMDKPMQEKLEPDADRFRKDDVWENSVGTQFSVELVDRKFALLVNLKTGRTARRAWDDIGAHTSRPWKRVSCGAAKA